MVASATTDGVPGIGGNFSWSDFTYDGENLLILTNDTQGGTRRSIIIRVHLGTGDRTFGEVGRSVAAQLLQAAGMGTLRAAGDRTAQTVTLLRAALG